MRYRDGNPSELHVGMKVVSDFRYNEREVVRTLTELYPDETTGSGYRASADCGGYCPTCRNPLGESIRQVDAAWFIPAGKRD